MKYIFLNLKRFDVPKEKGGVNSISPIKNWGAYLTGSISKNLASYADFAQFAVFMPEAHILNAKGQAIGVGCQGVHFENIRPDGNFGAFTTSLPAEAAGSLGCTWTIIGHCEERNKLKTILRIGGGSEDAVTKILEKSVNCAIESGLKVLFCVGETADEQPAKEAVLKKQLEPVMGLENIVIAYEPVWAIGPGKTPPNEDYIRSIAAYIKSVVPFPVVYGGGLKKENAAMLAGIETIDGGLIALTRFTGNIGFYPEEYLEIVAQYLGGS